jgi:DNA-binding beta-propeller fold protein YncE
MSRTRRALALLALVGAVITAAPRITAADAAPAPAGAVAESARGAVFVLTNDPTENAVVRYARQRDGSLVAAGTSATGGTGTGGGLGSQGALTLDAHGRYLYAVNPGSNSLSSFRVGRAGLELIDVVPTGGSMPTSVTVHGDLVYVLNAGDPGSISGFRVEAGDLEPLAGSTRPLSAAGTQPAQVSFTPDGRRLIVAERATQRFDVFTIGADGLPAGSPVIAASSGVTPFGFAFARHHHLVVSEAWGGATDASSVSSYDVRRGRFDVVSPSVPTTETSACWIAITPDGRFAYSGNAASMSITGYAVGGRGDLTSLTLDGKTASASGSVTDLAISSDGRSLYARLGNGTVGAWTIERDGTLTSIGAFPGLPAGAAGIAAS